MKKVVLNVLVVVTLCVATALLSEGIYAVARWGKLDGSITYQTYMRLAGNKDVGPWNDGTDASVSSEPEGPTFTRLLTRDKIDRLIPKLKAAAIGLGNSDYVELKQEAAAINTHEQGCRVQKAHLR